MVFRSRWARSHGRPARSSHGSAGATSAGSPFYLPRFRWLSCWRPAAAPGGGRLPCRIGWSRRPPVRPPVRFPRRRHRSGRAARGPPGLAGGFPDAGRPVDVGGPVSHQAQPQFRLPPDRCRRAPPGLRGESSRRASDDPARDPARPSRMSQPPRFRAAPLSPRGPPLASPRCPRAGCRSTPRACAK